MTFGSLFSGIGGMDLGLERAGLSCRWQVEIEPFAGRVLARHWPGVRRHDDVRTFPLDDTEDWTVDLICGGFPCQDISVAGKGAGIDGAQSGLWSEFARIVRILRPRYVLVENSPALLYRGMGRVLGDLAALGFDAEWAVLSPSKFGAPHFRERLFLLAYSDGFDGAGFRFLDGPGNQEAPPESARWLPDGASVGVVDGQGNRRIRRIPDGRICGVVDGSSCPLVKPRMKAIGNAVVPQIAEWIGRRILGAYEQSPMTTPPGAG